MGRNIKAVEREQVRAQVANAAAALEHISIPRQGWIKSIRIALGMSGAALSRRLGGGRTRAANLERYERDERLSLKSMREAASAMGCRFVYAIVPPQGESVESLLEAQAERRAKRIVRGASVHMALEAQQLGVRETSAEVERLKTQLLNEMPRDFWDPLDNE